MIGAMIHSRLARIAGMSLLLWAMCNGSISYASSPVSDKEKVVYTVRQMFVALTTDDLDLFKSVTSTDFYAFDGGERFNAEELVQLVSSAHASGKVYVWEVTDEEVHIDGNTAWVAYLNRGSIKDTADVKQLRWLESAVLRKKKGVWRIRFFHSTRVPSR